MAIAVAQATTRQAVNDAGSGNKSFSSLPAAGSTIIVPIGIYHPGRTATVTGADNQGGASYSQAVISSFGDDSRAVILYRENISAPSGTFTVTLTFSSNVYAQFGLLAVTGLATSSSLDKTDNDTGAAGTVSATGATAALAQADEFVVAVSSHQAPSGNVGFVNPSGYTEHFVQQLADAEQPVHAAYKIVAATTAVSANWGETNAGSAGGWGAVIATFKGAAAGGAITRNNSMLFGMGR
jgi:hypothetical protein